MDYIYFVYTSLIQSSSGSVKSKTINAIINYGYKTLFQRILIKTKGLLKPNTIIKIHRLYCLFASIFRNYGAN